MENFMEIDGVTISSNKNKSEQIRTAIEHQDSVNETTLDKINHQVREMNMKILEHANLIIGADLRWSFDDWEKNISLAIEHKRRLENLKLLLNEAFK